MIATKEITTTTQILPPPPPDRKMAQGTAGVTRQDITDLQHNTWVHHNEMHNSGVYDTGVHTEIENAGVQKTMNAPQNDHNDPQYDP